MFKRQSQVYTLEEYLALEAQAEYKSEYFQGEIFAMAGGSYNHNVIAGNLYAALHQFLAPKDCTAFTGDMRILVKKRELYTYPDVLVVCGRPKFASGRTDTLTNPMIIVEVLSKSTQAYDRGQKFEFYRSIDTFADYVLIDQERVHIEYFHKFKDGRWVLTELTTPDATLTLETIDFAIPLHQIYHKADWFIH